MRTGNLTVTARTQRQREPNSIIVIKFDLDEIKQHFDENLRLIKEQFSIIEQFSVENDAEKIRTIYQSQIILLESAFDFYLHELTKYGLSEMFVGNWEKTKKYNNISVKMSIVEEALGNRNEHEWFLKFINESYKSVTIMSFSSVKDHLNLLGLDLDEFANKVFYVRGAQEKPNDQFKNRLDKLFDIRNIIAHQSGRRHADAQLENITAEMVESSIDIIEKIVLAIHEQAKFQNNTEIN